MDGPLGSSNSGYKTICRLMCLAILEVQASHDMFTVMHGCSAPSNDAEDGAT